MEVQDSIKAFKKLKRNCKKYSTNGHKANCNNWFNILIVSVVALPTYAIGNQSKKIRFV